MARMAAASTAPTSGQGEFAAGWPVVLGAAIGIAIGIVLPGPAIGVFMHDLQSEFGWTRTQISLGPTLLFITLALLSPFQGWLADRIPPQWVAACSLAALSGGLFLFAFLDGSVVRYHLGFVVLGIAAGGSATIVYAKVISAHFKRHLGFALALAMLGAGVSQVLVPLLLTPYAAAAGWRAGFVALALTVAIGTPFVFLLITSRRPAGKASAAPSGQAALLAAAFRDCVFWIIAMTSGMIPLAVTGLQLHLLSYLADAGVDPVRAGIIGSMAGGSMIVARVATGVLIDRYFAPYVAAAMMAAAALGVAGMQILGPEAALLGAIAIGISLGAELDLLGYMTKRYFGLERFGRIYGIFYGTVLAGMSISQVGYGLLVDATGSYGPALWIAAVLLGLSALLFLTLPSFDRRSSDVRDPGSHLPAHVRAPAGTNTTRASRPEEPSIFSAAGPSKI